MASQKRTQHKWNGTPTCKCPWYSVRDMSTFPGSTPCSVTDILRSSFLSKLLLFDTTNAQIHYARAICCQCKRGITIYEHVFQIHQFYSSEPRWKTRIQGGSGTCSPTEMKYILSQKLLWKMPRVGNENEAQFQYIPGIRNSLVEHIGLRKPTKHFCSTPHQPRLNIQSRPSRTNPYSKLEGKVLTV